MESALLFEADIPPVIFGPSGRGAHAAVDSVLISYDSHFINIQGLCVWDEIRV